MIKKNKHNSGENSENNDYNITKNIENVFFGKPKITEEDESIIMEYYYYLKNKNEDPISTINIYFQKFIEPKMKKKIDIIKNYYSSMENDNKKKEK